jgi:hypothetical protein
MSIRSYYRWALALPLLVPALAWPLTLFNPLPDGLAVVAMFLYWSVLIGGIPYVLFAAGFLLWMRGRPDHRVRTAVYVAPLVYAVWLAVCLAVFLAVDGTLASSRESFGMITVCGLVFGYGYVGLAELGRALLRPGGAPAAPAPAV